MANQNGTTSVITNSFIKGMNKDITQSMEPEQSWWHARNAANNSTDGDLGVIGNEPSNLQCGVIPYTIIGAIHRFGDEWVVFSTDDINSEIGRFDDSECKYTSLVNDPCLAFNRKHLITGAAKENFDCTWSVYWDDANNPSRHLNIDDIPWKQYISSAAGDPCIVYSDIEPKQLNCEKIRLAPLLDTPCVSLEKSVDGGMISNGSYQAFVAYTENEQRVTDYIGISNVQSLWSHQGSGGSLNVSVTNLDTDYDYYELVLLIRQQGQVFAKRIGLYSTQQKDVNIDFIDDQLVPIDLKLIPQRSPAYEKSQAMYVVNDWLIRQGPVEQFDFNYQPIANEIKVNWVSNQIDSKYYYLGGNKAGFLRDEQYAFFIRWIYNTGERSSSYHIPGRAPQLYTINGIPTLENAIIYGDNTLDAAGDPLFQVYNTGTITSQGYSETQEDGSSIIARGQMGYWESTERYPINKPDIWGDLCGLPIRHHKFPTEEVGGANSPLHISTTNGDLINLLGVEFTNIGRPKNNDGSYITNVVGYEILRGSRAGAKSILAKGLFRNMREYTVPNSENLIGGAVQGLYPNYPYNDLRPDVYFWDKNVPAGDLKRTDGCHNFTESLSLDNFPPLKGYSKKVFTFSSPDLMFTKPFLNAYETRIYGQLSGNQSGNFIASEDHPQFKLLRNGSALMGAIIGIGYAIAQVQGETAEEINSNKMRWQANDFLMGPVPGTGATTGIGLNATANAAAAIGLATANVIQYAPIVGTNNLQLAAGLLDLWLGGSGTDLYDQSLVAGNAAFGLLPGTEAGTYVTKRKRNTSLSQLPSVFKGLVTWFTTASNIAIGGNEIIELIYNLVNKSDFVLKYNSAGFFNKFQKTNTGLWRFKNTDSNYLGQSFQTFNQGDYKINNLFRPSTVAVALEKELQNPSVEDKSRFVLGGDATLNATTGVVSPNDNGDKYLLDPSVSRKTAISAFYGALKFNFDNQYGQLSGIKQVPMRGCVELLDPTKPAEYLYSSKAIFGGDIYINRYTEKVIMPIFSQYLLGQPDEFTYDYSMHVNIPYPRFWLNSQKYDMSKLSRKIVSLGTIGGGGIDALLPNDLFYLDRGDKSCNNLIGSIVNNNDPNPMFAMRFAYMYSHSNGILDFFVESEVNLAQRDWEDRQDARIYDVYDYNDTKELFHAQIEKKDNFYKYDESLSVSKFPTQLSSFGEIQPLYYDPYVAANCYVSRPKRLIYSLQAQEESKKDFWRVFLPFNYKDFKNKVSVIKPINKSGAIVFFPYLSPQMFQGLDTLKTQLDTKLTIGDGGLFSQPFQNIANADLSNEYGSCESLRSVMNTPVGLFFISQAQGKIFQYGGAGLDPISNNGMKWWFNKYLPSQLVKQFPELEYSVLSDNPVIGVGCQTVYDPNDDIVYFMKKDFRVKQQYINSITYNEAVGFILSIREDGGRYSVPIVLGDPIYFDDCCWTISYDPKAKAWISFHDWCPELSLPSINHFFTTKSLETDIPQCPPGYNFNSTTGQCEITLNTTALSTVDISTVAATVTGGTVDCLIDVVIAMDWSGSTGTPNYNPVTGVMGNTSRATAQLRWLDVFLQDPAIQSELTSGNMQIGFTGWGTASTPWDPMSNTKSRISIINWYLNNWNTTNDTSAQQAIFGNANSPTTGNGALALLNNKAGSSLGDRSSSSFFKQILITVTDGTAGYPANSGLVANQQSPTIIAGFNQFANTGNWALANLGAATKQELIGVFCGANANWPTGFNPVILDSLTNTRYNTSSSTPGTNQYTMNAQNNSELESVANDVAGSLCSIPFVCSCPTGYTTVYLNPVTGTYSADAGDCNNITPPICRKIECECPTSPNGGTTTITGVCDDVYLVGNPDYVNPDPQLCNYYYINTTRPNYKVGSFWRHNSRCDDFASFYNVSYPWEVDLVANTGQQVNTVRSMEYQLECYVYKGDMGNACNDDKWEDLDFNFDQSVIYNNEQVSGLLQLTPTPYNQPLLNLTYPIIGLNNINILCSKVEQKYRFNQFWDITNDRGEFTNAEQPIWNTEPNGYIKNLNTINLNYNKPSLQHKKFRHYYTNVILRRVNSSNRKMLLRLNNSKLLTSLR